MFHPTRTSLGALLRKARRVGRGKTQLRRCYPDRYRSPLLGALNPGEFLPPRPSFMRRSLRSWSNLSTLEKVVFFVLSYLTSLAKAYGQLARAGVADGNGYRRGPQRCVTPRVTVDCPAERGRPSRPGSTATVSERDVVDLPNSAVCCPDYSGP